MLGVRKLVLGVMRVVLGVFWLFCGAMGSFPLHINFVLDIDFTLS